MLYGEAPELSIVVTASSICEPQFIERRTYDRPL